MNTKAKRAFWLILVLTLVIVASAATLVACGKTQNNETPSSDPETPPHVHAFGAWTTTVDPTCTEPGSRERYCICGEKETETIDPLGHNEVASPAVAATCSHTGMTEGRYCDRCGMVFVEQQVIPMLSHTIVKDEAVQPTCTSVGLTEGYHCSVCGRVIVEQQTINALGHDFDEHYHCSICNEDRDGFEFELVMQVGEHMVNEQNTCIFCGTSNVIEDFVFDESVATYSFRYSGSRTKLTLP